MAKDISKNVVVVLLMIAIVFGVAGTWIGLTAEPEIKYGSYIGEGNLRLNIESSTPPAPSYAAGNVVLNIQ